VAAAAVEVAFVCVPGQQPAAPSSAAEALTALEASLGYLAAADVADWPVDALAGCLRALGRAESAQLAARSRAMAAFNAQGGFEADGQPTVRTWLRWQTQITNGAAYAAAGWMRRLAVHPRVSGALAAAQVTTSFARLICDWSDLLPPGLRDEADEILLAAAAGGATQADLAMLAREMLERSAPPDPGGDHPGGDDDGFAGRRVWLDLHFRGAGKLNGDLTPECAAALAAMLDALGKKAGPEDTRTTSQRHHDALEEAARRLIAGGLPDTAGQPTQVQLHVTLDQLRDLPGAADAERSWASARAAADGTPGWVHSRAAAAAYARRRPQRPDRRRLRDSRCGCRPSAVPKSRLPSARPACPAVPAWMKARIRRSPRSLTDLASADYNQGRSPGVMRA
jgi:Domain of unknown function (DUF222)